MNARTPANFGKSTGSSLPDIEFDPSKGLDAVDRFLNNVFGRARGYLAVEFGYGPKVKGHDRPWKANTYRWPEDRDQARRDISHLQHRNRSDVYFCASLQRRPSRSRRGAADIWALSFELDDAPADPGLLDTLDAVQVESGTPGHRHVYVLLAQGVDTATADRLCRTLARAVARPARGVNLKWEANALLRVPNTWNYKTYWAPSLPARPGNASPRRVAIEKAKGKRWPVDELEALCASLTSDTNDHNDDDSHAPTVARGDNQTGLPAAVRAAFDRDECGDETGRGMRHHALVRACKDAGFSYGRTVAVVSTFPPSVEKYGHRPGGVEAQVRSSWDAAAGVAPVQRVDDWDHVIPLTRQPAPLPVDALGPVLGPLVDAMAVAYQVPTDLVVSAALPVITTALRGRWTVRVTESWRESLSLSTVSALASGERKSAVVRDLLDPLYRLEREAQDRVRDVVAHAERLHGLRCDEVDALKKKAKAGDYEAQERYLQKAAELDGYRPTPLPRWLADDVTPERLVRLLAEQGGALGVISTEPTLFRILSGRYSGGKPNLETVLKATAGDPIRLDRQGQGQGESVIVDHTALSLGLCIQPDLLADFGQGPFRGSGLLARFLYVLPAPMVGSRDIEDRPVPTGVRQRWNDALSAIIEAVDKIDDNAPAAEGGTNCVNIVDRFRYVRVDNRARGLLDEFRAELEPKLHPHHGELASLADWGSKLPGAVVRIAAALTLLTDAHADTVNADTMADAIRLGRAYVAHALAAFGSMNGRDDELRRADEVLGWLRRHRKPEFSVRDVHTALQGRVWVNGADDVKAAVETLIEYGHVREVEKKTTGRGRPSQKYELNPNSVNFVD